MNSVTHHRNPYALRAVTAHDEAPERRPEREAERGPSELLDIARRLRLVPPRTLSSHQPRGGTNACSVVVITGHPGRYKSSEFPRVGVDWILVTVALEALDHLLYEGDACIAVFTELDLPGYDNGYDVIEALTASGFEGPKYLIATHEPLARDREMARRRGACGIVRGNAESMQQVLDDVLASGATDHGRLMELPNTDGPSDAHDLPAWTRPVIRRLARLVGPTAGDHVRARYAQMNARYGRPPDPADLIEEVAEVLRDWPADMLRFVEPVQGRSRRESMMQGRFKSLPLQVQFRALLAVVVPLGCIAAFMLWQRSLDGFVWISIGAFYASLAGLLWFVQVQLIRPVRQISLYAQQVSASDLADLRSADLHFTHGDQAAGNELQRITVALKRLLRSLKVQRGSR